MTINDDSTVAALKCWAELKLPARIDAAQAAKTLGFPEHDIPVLIAHKKLKALGDPAPNAPKYFSAVEIIRLSTDMDWLNAATRTVSKYWRLKRERQNGLEPSTGGRAARGASKKPSTNPSTNPSISEHCEDADRAVGGQ